MGPVLAVDQGTSATKAVLYDEDGTVLARATQVVGRDVAGPAVTQDPWALLASVREAGRQAVRAAGRAPTIVALANQGESVVCWDRATGQPLSPVISWQDRRAEVACDEIRDAADHVAETTGLRLDSYFSGPKMRWLRRTHPDGVITTTDTFLLHHLCGAFVTDVTTASRTALMDLRTGQWSAEMARLFQVDPEALPQIVPCDAPVGETRLFGDTPASVCGLAVDQHAALWAHRSLAPDPVKVTYGTGAFVVGTVAGVLDHSNLTTSVAWSEPDGLRYCSDGQVYTAGAALTWLEQLGIVDDAGAAVSGLSSTTDAADSSTPVFVPALAGLGAPEWSPMARGVFAGLELSTNPTDLVRAVVDGIAMAVTTIVEEIAGSRGHPVDCLQVDGGLTRSAYVCQRQADLSGATVVASSDPDLTTRGVASLAARGVGNAMFDGAVSETTTYEPRLPEPEAKALRRRWTNARDLALSMGDDA